MPIYVFYPKICFAWSYDHALHPRMRYARAMCFASYTGACLLKPRILSYQLTYTFSKKLSGRHSPPTTGKSTFTILLCT